MSRVLTHSEVGYRRGCRCRVCRDAIARYRRAERARNRPAPCDVCVRVHPGACTPDDERSVSVSMTLPRFLLDRLDAVTGYGNRSAFVRRLLEESLS